MGPEHRGMYIWLSTASYSLKVSFSSYLKRNKWVAHQIFSRKTNFNLSTVSWPSFTSLVSLFVKNNLVGGKLVIHFSWNQMIKPRIFEELDGTLQISIFHLWATLTCKLWPARSWSCSKFYSFSEFSLEPVCCKKQQKYFLTSYWFVE